MVPSRLNPLPNFCLAVIARRSYPVHGHPLGSPIKGGPELELEPAPPLSPDRVSAPSELARDDDSNVFAAAVPVRPFRRGPVHYASPTEV